MWSRNLANLMISPLKPIEFILAMMAMSIVRLLIGMVPVSLLAIGFFGFNLYGMGLALAAFFLNLILTSWAVGIFVSGVIMRNGLGAENLAWTIMFLLMPLTCVYSPAAVLPPWLQVVAWSLPPTYVFEGMRALLIDHQFRADLMVEAFFMNMVLFAAGVTGFMLLLRAARRHGSLLQTGESRENFFVEINVTVCHMLQCSGREGSVWRLGNLEVGPRGLGRGGSCCRHLCIGYTK